MGLVGMGRRPNVQSSQISPCFSESEPHYIFKYPFDEFSALFFLEIASSIGPQRLHFLNGRQATDAINTLTRYSVHKFPVIWYCGISDKDILYQNISFLICSQIGYEQKDIELNCNLLIIDYSQQLADEAWFYNLKKMIIDFNIINTIPILIVSTLEAAD